jgi:hypothetical protein
MKFACALMWILSLFDGLATWFAISHGYAREANPFMELCIRHGWATFFVVKLLLTTVGCWGLWKLQNLSRVVFWLVVAIDGLYLAVAGLHVYIFTLVWRHL